MKKNITKPVLFLVFNRPATTKKVWNRIRMHRPTRIYIAADGPRPNNVDDIEKCKKVREIINNIDWKCDVNRLNREKNLGCKKAVSSAIDWFFENEKEGIILEDDTLPNLSFFQFAADMLDKYKDDKKIMHITGGNFLGNEVKIDTSYYFSKYIHIWGWATWRRAWKNYCMNMNSWRDHKDMMFMDTYKTGYLEKMYWRILFNAVVNNKIDTWDYQWLYSVWIKGGLGIIPSKNMIENIGFGKDATHTTSASSKGSLTFLMKKPYKHPKKIINDEAEKYTKDSVYKINVVNVMKQFLYYEAKK